MARKKQQKKTKTEAPKVLSDLERSGENTDDKYLDHEVLAAPKDPAKSSLSTEQLTAAQTPKTRQGSRFAVIRLPLRSKLHLSRLQLVLVICIFLTVLVLLYGLSRSLSGPSPTMAATEARQQTQTIDDQMDFSEQTFEFEIPIDDSGQPSTSDIKKPTSTASTEPLSLRVADDYYLQGDWAKAYSVYKKLSQSLSVEDRKVLKDFLELKMVFCVRKAKRAEQADRMLRAITQSRSPVIAAIARYYQCMDLIQSHKYLQAASKAYQIIAVLDAVEYDRDWALSLQQECSFVVSECFTRYVLSLCDTDKGVPIELFRSLREIDPFIGLEQEQLRDFLSSGLEQLNRALLEPQVQRIESPDGTVHWQVICNGAPIEELLARFANNAGLEVKWIQSSVSPSGGSKEGIQKRPIYLYLSSTTPLRFVTVAAGCASLLARMKDNQVVEIVEPSEYSSLSQHVVMLVEEAISQWRILLLTSNNVEYLPNIHFALGLLQAQREHPSDAIAEFKLVANRFMNTPFAPYALLYASKLKVDLRDYRGARDDFKQLIELYPDAEFSHEVCLSLADATMKAGLFSEAATTYSKVYNLSLSVQAQAASALGAGKCFYQTKEYEEATKWLTRYIGLEDNRKSENFSMANFLLGKAYFALGKSQQACKAFQRALNGPLPREWHIEAISALVDVQIQQGYLIEALCVLEKTSVWQLSQKESTEVLLIKAQIFRSMGLIDKAMALLTDRAEYLPDLELRGRIYFEMARCFIAKRQWEQAHKSLTSILLIVEPGPLTQQVQYELALVSMKLGQTAQTIAICSQILESTPSEDIKIKVNDLLAEAYKQQKDYDKTAKVLLGEYNAPKSTIRSASESSVEQTEPSVAVY